MVVFQVSASSLRCLDSRNLPCLVNLQTVCLHVKLDVAAGDSLGNNIMLFEHPVIDRPLIPRSPSPKRYHQKVARPKTLDGAPGACALKRLLALGRGRDRGPVQEALATQGQGYCIVQGLQHTRGGGSRQPLSPTTRPPAHCLVTLLCSRL